MRKFLKNLDGILTLPFFVLGYMCCAIIATFKYGGNKYMNHLKKDWKL